MSEETSARRRTVSLLAWIMIGATIGVLVGATVEYHLQGSEVSSASAESSKQFLYVFNPGSKDISIIDPTIPVQIVRIPLPIEGSEFEGILSKDRKSIFVVDVGGERVYQLSASSLEVASIIPVGGELQHAAKLTVDGKYLLVVSRSEEGGGLVFVDTVRGFVSERVVVGVKPHHVALSSDGELAYVTDTASPEVKVVSLASKQVLRSISVGSPTNMALLHPSEVLILSSLRSNSVLFYDLSSDRLLGSVTVGEDPHDLELAGDSRHLFVANWKDDTVSVIDMDQKKVIATLKTEAGPNLMTPSEDGKRIYVSNSKGGSITVIDAIEPRIIATVKVGTSPTNVLLSTPVIGSSTEQAEIQQPSSSQKELDSANFTCGG